MMKAPDPDDQMRESARRGERQRRDCENPVSDAGRRLVQT